MKMKSSIIISILISIMVISFSVLFFLDKKVIFSENENRYLESFPKLDKDSLFSGNYTSSLEDYINDHVPYRDNILFLKNDIEILLGKTKMNDIYIGKDKQLIPDYHATDLTKKIEKINAFVGNNTVSVDVMIVPNAIAIYPENLKQNSVKENQIEDIQNLYEKLNSNNIDVSDIFLSQKNTYPLYYHTDHHWTMYGAYFAALQYETKHGLEQKRLEDYSIQLMSNQFYGTSYSKVLNHYTKPDKFYIFEDGNSYQVFYPYENIKTNSLYNYDYLKKKDKYSTYLDNNHALITIQNTNYEKEDDILIIKNSYGNAFIPLIAGYYHTIYVIDLRYYNKSISDFLLENSNIKQVLIIYDMEGLSSDTAILKLR